MFAARMPRISAWRTPTPGDDSCFLEPTKISMSESRKTELYMQIGSQPSEASHPVIGFAAVLFSLSVSRRWLPHHRIESKHRQRLKMQFSSVNFGSQGCGKQRLDAAHLHLQTYSSFFGRVDCSCFCKYAGSRLMDSGSPNPPRLQKRHIQPRTRCLRSACEKTFRVPAKEQALRCLKAAGFSHNARRALGTCEPRCG